MTAEVLQTPEMQGPTPEAFALAGALQAVVNDIPNRDFDLDVHQRVGLQKIGIKLLDGETAGYIDAATGSGKTLFIALLAEAAVRAGQRVHIMANMNTITDQIVGEDGETGIGAFTPLLEEPGIVKQNYGGRRANAKHRVVVSTYPGMLGEHRAIEQGRGRLGKFNLILADECDTSLGTETSRAMLKYMPDATRIGFSATPDVALDRKSEELYSHPWFEFSLNEAIDAGVASHMRPLLYATGQQLELTDYRNEFTEKELAPLMDNFERNGAALKLAQDFIADGRQGIIRCISGGGNLHARIMAGLLSQMKKPNGDPIVAEEIGGHLDQEERRRRLRDYREGKIDVLTFTRALEAGWDSNCASFCLNLAPSTSPRVIIQLLGRIGRPKLDGKEGIFVDFVDETVGLAKDQYTALHALDFEDIDMDRILGEGGYGSYDTFPRAQRLRNILRPQLLQGLMRVQGKTLREALRTSSSQRIDPLIALWDRKLAKEGLPAELPDNITFTPKLDANVRRASGLLLRREGVEPSTEELIEQLRDKKHLTLEQTALLREYGERVPWPETIDQLAENRESTHQILVRLALEGQIQTALDTLTEREAGIISLRYGLTDGVPRSLDDTGKVYGITRERTRQIETKTLSKLRAPVRSQPLRHLSTEFPDTDTDKPPYQKVSTGRSAFHDIPKIPAHDDEDSRPYSVRLSEAAQKSTGEWLKAQEEDLKKFVEERLTSMDYLRIVAAWLKPVHVLYKGDVWTERPDGVPGSHITNIYNLDEVRAEALRMRRRIALQELQTVRAAEKRIRNRPASTVQSSLDARQASLTALGYKRAAMEALCGNLRRRINKYEISAFENPQHVAFPKPEPVTE